MSEDDKLAKSSEPDPQPGGDAKEETKEMATHGWALLRGLFGIGRETAETAAQRYRRFEELTSPLPAETRDLDPAAIPEETGRETDRELEPASDTARSRRERLGTVLVAVAFLSSMAGGVGFLVAYWTGGSNEWLGGALAICLGGAAAGFVFAAHYLMAEKRTVQPREQHCSPCEERAAITKTWSVSTQEIRRRTMLQWMMAGTAGVLAASFVSLLRSVGSNPNSTLYSTVWKRGQRLLTVDGRVMKVDSLTPNTTVTVFPEDSVGSEKTQTVLIRVDAKLLQMPAQRADWTPMGYVAYSRVCTHAGCPVGLYETDTCQLLCPCHQSTFDVLRAATPTGGPAARALPQLPLYADADGTLRAAGGFSYPTGPGFWGMP